MVAQDDEDYALARVLVTREERILEDLCKRQTSLTMQVLDTYLASAV